MQWHKKVITKETYFFFISPCQMSAETKVKTSYRHVLKERSRMPLFWTRAKYRNSYIQQIYQQHSDNPQEILPLVLY